MDYSLCYFDDDNLENCGIMREKEFKNTNGYTISLTVEALEALLEIANDEGSDWVNVLAFEKRERTGRGNGGNRRNGGSGGRGRKSARRGEGDGGSRRRTRAVKEPPEDDDEIPF